MLVTRPPFNHRGAVRAAGGFTLVELLVVFVMVAIGALVAMPSLSEALTKQRVRAATTDLASSLMLARSEAIKRSGQIRLAPVTGTNWTSGWRVTGVSAGDQIERKDALGTSVVVSRAPTAIVYERTGRLVPPAVVRVELSDAARTADRTSCITIDPSGMPKVATGACP